MKIALLGGYGNISWWCTKEALERGYDVYVINRQETIRTRRKAPEGVHILIADYRNMDEMHALLKKHTFDVVCDFICYTEEHAKNAVELFKGKTKQYIFISSEAIYDRTKCSAPFNESSPKYDARTVSGYIADKIRAEQVFIEAYEKESFPVTIVRPGFTYDTILPNFAMVTCFTVYKRCLEGFPWIIIEDGEAMWTFTHSSDFARACVALFGKKNGIGEDYIITTNRLYSWNEASRVILENLGLQGHSIIHIPYTEERLSSLYPSKELIYHSAVDSVSDTTKISTLCPMWSPQVSFEEGVSATLLWLSEENERQRSVPKVDEIYKDITAKYYVIHEGE
ncbi:MAG: NAD-dependent epimerase/dehydratase family protein [Desulfovibrionaceae bacterium]